MDQSLVLWDDPRGIETSSLSWERKTEAMLRETIHHNKWIMAEDESMLDRIVDKIFEIYLRNIKLFEGIPDFDEIFKDVETYNDGILARIAEIQYENEGYPENPDLDPNDAMYEIERMWRECNEFDMWDNLEDFVKDVLSSLNSSFFFPDNYMSAQILGDDVSIVVNDAQSCIFPEFSEDDVLSSYCSDVSRLMIIGRV